MRIVAAGLVAAGAILITGCVPASPEGRDGRGPLDSPADGGGEHALPDRIEAPQDLPETYRPHREFDLTMEEMRGLLAAQPPEVQQAILAEPAVFLEYAKQLLPWEPHTLALVDKESRLPAEYAPEDLVSLQEYGNPLILNRDGLALRAVIMPDLLAMVEAAGQDGIQLDISSTYRSYDYQRDLFAYWVEELGQAEAERVSARPGTSQHQLGTTVDFGSITPAFAEHPAGVWLAEHAEAYGFSLSYPDGYEKVTGYSYEPWHFRWISRSGTQMEARYFGGIQQHFLEFWAEAETVLRDACTGGT